jgi:hypothetical protein
MPLFSAQSLELALTGLVSLFSTIEIEAAFTWAASEMLF